MALLNKSQILAADDRTHEDVPVPEWGGAVRIVGLSGKERDAWESSLLVLGPNGSVQRRNSKGARAGLLARALVGEDGERLFTDKEIAELNEKSGAILEKLAVVASRLSGIGKDQVEEKAGNSGAAPSGGSTSA